MTASISSEAAVLGQLKQIFPHHSSSLLRNAATQHNFDVELTIANLLAADTYEQKPLQVPQLQQPRDWLRKSKPKVRSGGWHSLTKQQQPGIALGAGVSFQPQHSAQHARPPQGNSGEFPSLGGGSSGTPTQGPPAHCDGSTPAGPAADSGSRSHRSAQRPHTPLDAQGRTKPRTSTPGSAGGPANGDAAALSHDFARVLGKSDSAKREAAAEEQQAQQVAAAELMSLHPWAGHGLVQAVLAGLGGERRAAGQVLDEMLAARMAQQRRSSDGGARRSGDSGTKGQAHVPDAALANAASAPACPAQSPDDYDLAADLAEEPYRQHRGEAIRLTHTWQRGMRRAAAAFAAGDSAAAGRIAQEARRKREEALEAHGAAAQRILHDNNAARGRAAAELDLHGLHASEAVAALDAHLQGLEADSGPSSAAVERVRVIVGRGRHSAGGEATLPRAVETYLMDAGRKYSARGGAFEVQLRRGNRRPGSALTR